MSANLKFLKWVYNTGKKHWSLNVLMTILLIVLWILVLGPCWLIIKFSNVLRKICLFIGYNSYDW